GPQSAASLPVGMIERAGSRPGLPVRGGAPMTDASGRGAPLTLIMCLCVCLAAHGASAREHDTGARTFGNDVFMAGSNVVTDGSAGGALLAGGWISTSGGGEGEEGAAGGQGNLGASGEGGVYAAGGHARPGGRGRW